MFKFIEFLQKRPKDVTIRAIRIIFGLIIALLLGLNLGTIGLHIPEAIRPYETYVLYSLFIFAFFPIFMGATGLCFAKKKHVKIAQIILGTLLVIVGNMVIETKSIIPEKAITQSSSGLDYRELAKTSGTKTPMNVGFWIALLGFFPIIGGISGKLITEKCLKHGEIIKKIRV